MTDLELIKNMLDSRGILYRESHMMITTIDTKPTDITFYFDYDDSLSGVDPLSSWIYLEQ